MKKIIFAIISASILSACTTYDRVKTRLPEECESSYNNNFTDIKKLINNEIRKYDNSLSFRQHNIAFVKEYKDFCTYNYSFKTNDTTGEVQKINIKFRVYK